MRKLIKTARALLDALSDQGHADTRTLHYRRSRAIESFYGPDGRVYDVYPTRRGRVTVVGPDGRLTGSYADVTEAQARIAQQHHRSTDQGTTP